MKETTFQRARRELSYSDIRICECCMFINANGESSCDPMYMDEEGQCAHSRGMAESLADGRHHLTLGQTTDECGHDLGTEGGDEAHSEECERLGFSWWSCDLCGVSEGGERYAATLWPIKEGDSK
jgi:hypothetical protein